MLAHELRNPLAPIRNALQVMKMPGASESIVEQVREMAERQVQHMAHLLDDLLDVSRISRGKVALRKQPVDIVQVVNRTVEAVHSLIEDRQHRLTISLPPESVWVEGDPTRLEQVLTNLLNNAAKYTDPGGQIYVAVDREGADVVLRVSDTGIGIPADVLPRVFDLFVQVERRLDRSQGGIGIGLTLVKRLVELHGGSVEATSEGAGQGSEFTVRLPTIRNQLGAQKARGSVVEKAAQIRARRVLVVDDNHDAADSLAMLLRLAGHDIRVAYLGLEALDIAQQHIPEMIFLDIGMPGMDGYEVATRVRQMPGLERVLLVALTGWGQEEDRRRTKEAGFDYHLVKPVEPGTLQKLFQV
jgi:CheY-like chemotaxis protein/two-component sensor histidine kinase